MIGDNWQYLHKNPARHLDLAILTDHADTLTNRTTPNFFQTKYPAGGSADPGRKT
jgi:hypothetical protein